MSGSPISAAFGLAQFIPSIARWLAGEKAEEVAQNVLNIAKRITGIEDSPDIIRLLLEQPELVVEFQRAILNLEAEMELAVMQDKQDARLRDMALIKAGRNNTRADIMVISAAGGLISCLVTLAYYSEFLPGEAVGIISTVAGIFGSCLKDAYAFEFGSSRESKMKDTTMAALFERDF
ncbi:hypothetical protein [Candidatus Odyssella acanthamoebae]|uniref:Uncharacterized protein n=1 Tax=Candidatus Odyssella acanthamoebae TaxID=91604 RepID=A0A077AT99_9PROT|nr:hypothetical protein [Candidatus Paracaedibacter acanthamoebae]AIK96407.1 hypothetical protein ID47_06145 [Candidatus Paracaedibacter acanthamoebae]